MIKEKDKPLRKDVILIGLLILIGLVLLLCVLMFSKNGQTVEVRVDGKVSAKYMLWQDNKITLIGADGGMNVLVIQNGEAWVEEADCPDGLCKKTGKISKQGQSIICLPHKLVIEITGDSVEQSDSNSDDIDIYVK